MRLASRAATAAMMLLSIGPVTAQQASGIPADYQKVRRRLAKQLVVEKGPFKAQSRRELENMVEVARDKLGTEGGTSEGLAYYSLAAGAAIESALIHEVVAIDAALERLKFSGADRYRLLREAWTFKPPKRRYWAIEYPSELGKLETEPLAMFEFHLRHAEAAAKAGRLPVADKALSRARTEARKIRHVPHGRKGFVLRAYEQTRARLAQGLPIKAKPAKLQGDVACAGYQLTLVQGKSTKLPDLFAGKGERIDLHATVQDGRVKVDLQQHDFEKHGINTDVIVGVSAWLLPASTGKHRLNWRLDKPGPILVNGAPLRIPVSPKSNLQQGKAELMLQAGQPYLLQAHAHWFPVQGGKQFWCRIELWLDGPEGETPLDLRLDDEQAKKLGVRAPARPVAKPSVPVDAKHLQPSASHTYLSLGFSLAALKDGVVPENGLPRHTWLDHLGTKEWVQYDFDQPRMVSATDVRWFAEAEAAGPCRAPESWRLVWSDGKTWRPVETLSKAPYTSATDKMTRVEFRPVKARAVRLEVQMRKASCAAILEWQMRGPAD